jgi:hypothetical protein
LGFSENKNKSSRLFLGRRSFFVLAAILVVAACFSGVKSPQIASSLPSVKGVCPYHTPEEWQQFLERYANNAKWVVTCEDEACDKDYYKHVSENVQNTFEICAAYIDRHPEIKKCTANMRKFTPAWMLQHSYEGYGFIDNNHNYLKAQDAPDQPPGMMKIPPAIVSALPYRSRVEKVARENGWKYLTHDSALDDFRTFIFISDPQGRFDQWFLLNLAGGKGDRSLKDTTPLSILTVQKKDQAGRKFAQVKLHFRDYTLMKTKTGYKLELFEANNGKCFSCHTSGIRQLIARRTPMTEASPVKGEAGYNADDSAPPPEDFGLKRLNEFNSKLRSYGMPDWDGQVRPEDHGPHLGAAQGCTDCHDGNTRGALYVSLSHSQLEKKLFHELSMPSDTHLVALLERSEMKNPELTSDESFALQKGFESHEDMTKEFENSRFPILKHWFLESPCGPVAR